MRLEKIKSICNKLQNN